MSLSLSKSLFDCKQEEESDVLLKFKDKKVKVVFSSWDELSSWDEHIKAVNSERKSTIVKQLVEALYLDEALHLDAIRKLKEMIIGDSDLAAGLKPSVFERLVDILDEKNNESTKGSAACILAFADFDKCEVDKGVVGFKKKATDVLVGLMSVDSYAISIPVLKTLTRLAYVRAGYARFIMKNGALEGALKVIESNSPSPKWIQNLAKFLVAVVPPQVEVVPSHKVGTFLTILDKILDDRTSSLCSIVRACYALSCIPAKQWDGHEGNIYKNLLHYIEDWNDMVAYYALRVVANIVKSGNSCKMCEILTEDPNFLRCLGESRMCCRPKKFQKEACLVISNIADKRRSSVKDMNEAGLIDALSKLLEVDEVDVRMEAARTIRKVLMVAVTKELA